MTTTKQPDQKPASESAILSAEMEWQRSRRLLPKILPIGMLGLIIISGFMIWKLPVFQTSNWAVVFEDRSFDAPTRRLALLELKSLGITLRTSVRGEIEVHPDQLSVVESALENKGLKPATLAEIRQVQKALWPFWNRSLKENRGSNLLRKKKSPGSFSVQAMSARLT